MHAANRLLRRQGYASTGLQEIAREGSTPIGSLYFHFPGGKQELAAIAMQHGASEFGDVLSEALDSSDDLGTCYARLATLVGEKLEANGWALGCPVATTALETVGRSPVLQAAARSAFAAWRDLLVGRALRAGVAGRTAEALASNALALLEGAEMLARVEHSIAPLAHAAGALQALADQALKSGR